MSLSDFQNQIRYAHTVRELNSLMMQWSLVDGSRSEKEAVFEELCQRREQMMQPAQIGQDEAVKLSEILVD